MLFIATSHAVTGEHRGWSPSYLDSIVVPRGYSGSLEQTRHLLVNIKSPVLNSAVKHWWNPLTEFGGLGTLTTWLRRWWSGLRGYSRSLALPCSAVDLRLFESWRAVRHCGSYTVQRSGAHRDSLEQFGQQLSLWLLLASLSDPCHNSVTSSQSKFQILFYCLVIVFH